MQTEQLKQALKHTWDTTDFELAYPTLPEDEQALLRHFFNQALAKLIGDLQSEIEKRRPRNFAEVLIWVSFGAIA